MSQFDQPFYLHVSFVCFWIVTSKSLHVKVCTTLISAILVELFVVFSSSFDSLFNFNISTSCAVVVIPIAPLLSLIDNVDVLLIFVIELCTHDVQHVGTWDGGETKVSLSSRISTESRVKPVIGLSGAYIDSGSNKW